jgi:hypothetical protein
MTKNSNHAMCACGEPRLATLPGSKERQDLPAAVLVHAASIAATPGLLMRLLALASGGALAVSCLVGQTLRVAANSNALGGHRQITNRR